MSVYINTHICECTYMTLQTTCDFHSKSFFYKLLVNLIEDRNDLYCLKCLHPVMSNLSQLWFNIVDFYFNQNKILTPSDSR